MSDEIVHKAKLSDIKFDTQNANKGSERGRYMVEASMREFGFADAGTIDKNNRLLNGNKRTEVAGEIDLSDDAIIIDVDGTKPVYIRRNDLDLDDPDDDRARKLAYALNRSAEVSLTWDIEQIAADVGAGIDLSMLFHEDELDRLLAEADAEANRLAGGGISDDGYGGSGGGGARVDPQVAEQARATLRERFLIPPFSVFDARQGYWQARKRAWLALGIQSELGRGENRLDMSATAAGISDPAQREAWNEQRRHPANPGGDNRPATKLGENGRTVRGDGMGRAVVKGALETSDLIHRLKPSADQALKHEEQRKAGSNQ